MRHSIMLLAYLAGMLLLCPFSSKAQRNNLSQLVKGTVLDKAVKTPIIGATIQIIESTGGLLEAPLGAISDLDGAFRIPNVPVGKITLKVSYIGYKELILNNITVNSGKEVALSI